MLVSALNFLTDLLQTEADAYFDSVWNANYQPDKHRFEAIRDIHLEGIRAMVAAGTEFCINEVNWVEAYMGHKYTFSELVQAPHLFGIGMHDKKRQFAKYCLKKRQQRLGPVLKLPSI